MRPHRPDGAVPMVRVGVVLRDEDHGAMANMSESVHANPPPGGDGGHGTC